MQSVSTEYTGTVPTYIHVYYIIHSPPLPPRPLWPPSVCVCVWQWCVWSVRSVCECGSDVCEVCVCVCACGSAWWSVCGVRVAVIISVRCVWQFVFAMRKNSLWEKTQKSLETWAIKSIPNVHKKWINSPHCSRHAVIINVHANND